MSPIRGLLEAACRKAPDGLALRWTRDGVEARMPDGRVQRIRVEARPEDQLTGARWRFETTVASKAIVDARGREGVAHDVLLRNRSTRVVAFGFDARDRLIAWVEHPVATLQPVEVALILASLARAADRLEWLLTADDAH